MPNSVNLQVVTWSIEHDLDYLTVPERQQLTSRGWRDRRPDEYPPAAADCRSADYAHDLDRGTLDYTPDWRNYSFHKVRIPDGTTVIGCNFSQAQPDTLAITVLGTPGSVVFRECNLANVRLHPSWVLDSCNTSQSWIVLDAEGNEDRVWVARHPEDLPAQIVPPLKAITRRDF